ESLASGIPGLVCRRPGYVFQRLPRPAPRDWRLTWMLLWVILLSSTDGLSLPGSPPPLSSPHDWRMRRGAKKGRPAILTAGLRQFGGDGRARARSGVSTSMDLGLAGPAAAARIAKANVAAAAALAACFQAVAAGLQHLAALGVAAGAGDAAAVLRVLAL